MMNSFRSTEKRLYTLLLSNSSGYELPTTGGVGMNLITSAGSFTTAFAWAALLLRKRQ